MGKYKDPNYKKKWYQKNKDKIRERNQSPEARKRKAVNDRKYFEKHRYKVLLKKREYTRNNKSRKREYDLMRKKSNPLLKKEFYKRNRAQVLAGNKARAYIKIPNGMSCQICKLAPAIHRHHEDYSRPLDVIFCCRLCHENLDKERRKKDLVASPEDMLEGYKRAWGEI